MTPSPTAWIEIGRNKHWVVSREPARRIIRVARTDVPFGDSTNWPHAVAALADVIGIFDRATHAVLLDLRAAAMSTDPEFERRVVPLQRKALDGFARAAVLVRTAVGLLQVTRSRRQSGGDTHGVFQDEDAALAYLGTPRDRRSATPPRG
jgi:hypothetical protein